MAGPDPDPALVARLWARIVLGYTDPAYRDDFAADLIDLLVRCVGAPVATATAVVGLVDLDSLDYAGDDLDLEDAEDAAYDLLVGLRSDVVAQIVLRGGGGDGGDDADALIATARAVDARYDAVLDVVDDLALSSMDDYIAAGWPDDDPVAALDGDGASLLAPPPEPGDAPLAAPPPRRRRWLGGS